MRRSKIVVPGLGESKEDWDLLYVLAYNLYIKAKFSDAAGNVFNNMLADFYVWFYLNIILFRSILVQGNEGEVRCKDVFDIGYFCHFKYNKYLSVINKNLVHQSVSARLYQYVCDVYLEKNVTSVKCINNLYGVIANVPFISLINNFYKTNVISNSSAIMTMASNRMKLLFSNYI